MKLSLIFILLKFFLNSVCICNEDKLRFNNEKNKYIIKKMPKIPEPNEWNVPQAPEMAAYVYPGIEWHTLDQKYDEMVSGEDLAQIETMVGKALPNNAKLIGMVQGKLISNANKIKNR